MCVVFFFFKQKTAYEMRISDWSSDVCSSDLTNSARSCARSKRSTPVPRLTARSLPLAQRRSASGSNSRTPASRNVPKSSNSRLRSEEHTSELQSLMRISYAVFCLKKKTTQEKIAQTQYMNCMHKTRHKK